MVCLVISSLTFLYSIHHTHTHTKYPPGSFSDHAFRDKTRLSLGFIDFLVTLPSSPCMVPRQRFNSYWLLT